MRKQGIILKDSIDLPFIRRKLCDILISEQDSAGQGCLKTRYHPEQSGLAAAARSQKGKQFSLFNGQIDIIDCYESVKALGDTLNPNLFQLSETLLFLDAEQISYLQKQNLTDVIM